MFATLIALVWLGEPVGAQTAAGIVVLVAGLVTLAVSRGGDLSGWSAWELGFPVAVVDPIAVTAPLFTTVFAYFLLRDVERITRGIVLGAALIVAGGALIVGGDLLGPVI